MAFLEVFWQILTPSDFLGKMIKWNRGGDTSSQDNAELKCVKLQASILYMQYFFVCFHLETFQSEAIVCLKNFSTLRNG